MNAGTQCTTLVINVNRFFLKPFITMAKREKAFEKAAKYDEILKQIKDGELEVIAYNGLAAAWKLFNKLRFVKEPKGFVEYVQCKKCKVIRSYVPQNGVTTLGKHKCRSHNDEEEDVIAFKDISPDKASNIKDMLLQKSMELCAEDVISIDTIFGTGFLKFSQYMLALSQENGYINLQPLFPTKTSLSRHVRNFKGDEQCNAQQIFKEAISSKYCSIAMNFHETNGGKKLLVHAVYFDNDLGALERKVLFAMSFDDLDNLEKIGSDIKTKFTIFGCDENMLKELNAVTPKEDIFADILKEICHRTDCAAFIINLVLKAFVQNKEFGDIFFTCKALVNYLIETEKSAKLTFSVVEDNGTWKNKVKMIEGLNKSYNELLNILNEEEKNKFKYNKKLAEELVKVLELFADGIVDLQSTAYPTSNKILLWWYLLKEHLKASKNHSVDMKRTIAHARTIFEMEYIPTMNQKVACFLDPRYRLLKMISADERSEVICEVRLLLSKMPDPPINAELPGPAPPAKKSKFSHLEANDDDIEERDEVDTYIYAIELKSSKLDECEFNVIGRFWKNNENKLPKLFKLATTLLHIPACCCTCEITSNFKDADDSEMFEDLLFIRDKFQNIR